jgi:SAM-dependent methyltransferase
MITTADFESLYQGQGLAYGPDGARMDDIPWRLDGPQPLIVELDAAGEITGPVLEAGCGLGDNAVFLAGRGHQVTAFDAAETAIEAARTTAGDAGLAVTFLVADATTLRGVPTGFTTVIDSALLHCLTDTQRDAYLAALARVCAPGARLHVLCFQPELAAAMPMTAHLDPDSLRRAFTAAGWDITRMQTRRYTTGLTPHAFAAQIPTAMREQLPPELDHAETDDQHRLLLPIWQISARLR